MSRSNTAAEPKNTADTGSITILLAGTERCDILEILSQIGMREGRKVCVIDDSYSHDLFIAKEPSEDSTDTDRDNIMYYKDVRYDEAMKEYYDVIFIYSGMRDDVKVRADYNIIQSDSAKHNLMRVKKIMENMSIDDYFLIYRDREGKKIRPSSMISFLGKDPQETAVLDLSVDDFSAYTAFTVNGHMVDGLKNYSEGMQGTIAFLCEKLYNIDSKTFKRRYI